MIVCLCAGVSDGEVRATLRRGACTLPELAQRCGAGGDCGSCLDRLRELVDDSAGAESDSRAIRLPRAGEGA